MNIILTVDIYLPTGVQQSDSLIVTVSCDVINQTLYCILSKRDHRL